MTLQRWGGEVVNKFTLTIFDFKSWSYFYYLDKNSKILEDSRTVEWQSLREEHSFGVSKPSLLQLLSSIPLDGLLLS